MRSPAKNLALALGVLLLAGSARTVAAQQTTPRKLPPIPMPRALGAPVPAKREDGIDLAAVEKKFASYIQEIQQADARLRKLAGAKKCFISNVNFFRTLPIEITLDTMRREGAARDAAHPWVRKVDVAAVDEQMARWREIDREAEAAVGRIGGECGFREAQSVDAILDRGSSIFTTRLMPAMAPRQSGISTVVIDYNPWEASQRQLLDEYKRKRQYADDLEQQFTAKRAAWEAAEQRASASAALLNAATRARDAALARARATSPDDRQKSSYYRTVEDRLAKAKARADQIYERLATLKKTSPNAPPEAVDRLLKEYDDLQAEQKRLEVELEKLQQQNGFSKMKADARAEFARLDEQAFAAAKKHALAAADRDVALKAAERAMDDRDRARDAAAKAETDWCKFRDLQSPLVKTIRVSAGAEYYNAEIWNPRDVLETNRQQLDLLRRHLDELATARWEARQDFIRSQTFAINQLDALERGMNQSKWSQAFIEWGFMAWDVAEKAVEKGPIGALTEAAKKMVEAWWLGPPEFVDPSVGYGQSDGTTWEQVKDVAWENSPGWKRLKKSGASSQVASGIVAKFLAAKEPRVLADLEKAASKDLWNDLAPRLGGYYEYAAKIEAQTAAIKKAQADWREAVRLKVFHNDMQKIKAGLVGHFKKFAEGWAKDAAKRQLKQAAADFLEGTALENYIEAELQARTASRILLAASYGYWHAKDEFDLKVAEREEILKQYDAKNSMKVVTNRPITSPTELTIDLTQVDTNKAAELRDVVVLLGGLPARRVSPSKLQFAMAYGMVQTAAREPGGGLKLEIRVMR